MKERLLTTLSLFTSSGTLICCALPALLVTLGFGSVLAGFLSTVPWLVQLSHHKKLVFLISGILLGVTWLILYGPLRRKATAIELCGTDSSACETAGKFTRFTFWISFAIYLIGFFMAFLYLPLTIYLERL